jgi:hypothetical protein
MSADQQAAGFGASTEASSLGGDANEGARCKAIDSVSKDFEDRATLQVLQIPFADGDCKEYSGQDALHFADWRRTYLKLLSLILLKYDELIV